MKLGLRGKVILVIEMVVVVVALSTTALVLMFQEKFLVPLTDAQLRMALVGFWSLVGCISLLAGIVGYVFGGSVIRLLRELRDFALKIKGGDFTVRTDISSADEIGDIARSFNDMVGYLNQYTTDLENEITTHTKELHEKIVEGERSKAAILNILDDVGASAKQLERKTEDLTKFQQAVDASFDHTIITDSHGIILHANHAAEVLTGYSKEEMIGLRPSLWGGQMPKSFYETLWKTIKVEKLRYTGELTNKRKDGKIYLANIRISPIFDNMGEVKFFVGIERDITEERAVQRRIIQHADELFAANGRIEEQKNRAESILRFLKSIGEGVFATDIDGKIIFMNESAEVLSGKMFQDVEYQLSKEAFSFVQETVADEQRVFLVDQTLKKKRASIFSDKTFLIHGDKKIPVSGTCSLIRDASDVIIGTITVFQDITKKHELDQMKDSFLSVAAHQLRTPLGSMRWSMELLLNGDLGKLPKEAVQVVSQIYDNSLRMVALVNDLLDVSRIDQNRGKEEKKPTDVIYTLQEIIKVMSAEAEQRSVEIVLNIPKESIAAIMVPPKHLYESFENLIANSIKYNKKDGQVIITVETTDKAVLVTIADKGIGIPKEDQSKIFSKFFRSSNAVRKDTSGSGLGLSVVKSYLEEAGARVWFESEENVGTKFFISFPFRSTDS